MVRAPYPARIAAGLVVTAIEETRKLPTLVVTLPMTAVSQTLQAGMRMQQNIAELAIKGDAALGMLFDRPSEQPEWARFDEDEASVDDEASRTPIETKTTSPSPPADKPAKAGAPASPRSSSTADEPEATEAELGVAAKPARDAGRFALYSSPPEDLVGRDGGADKPAETSSAPVNGSVPEIVEYLEYDALTLAQLRAKLRTVSTEELTELADYEKATKARAPFLTMIDNRIAAQNKRPSTT